MSIEGLDLIIKYLIKVYRGSIAMGLIPKPWRDVAVVQLGEILSLHKPHIAGVIVSQFFQKFSKITPNVFQIVESCSIPHRNVPRTPNLQNSSL